MDNNQLNNYASDVNNTGNILPNVIPNLSQGTIQNTDYSNYTNSQNTPQVQYDANGQAIFQQPIQSTDPNYTQYNDQYAGQYVDTNGYYQQPSVDQYSNPTNYDYTTGYPDQYSTTATAPIDYSSVQYDQYGQAINNTSVDYNSAANYDYSNTQNLTYPENYSEYNPQGYQTQDNNIINNDASSSFDTSSVVTKKPNSNLILIGIAGLVSLLLIGAGVFFYFFTRSKTTQQPVDTLTSSSIATETTSSSSLDAMIKTPTTSTTGGSDTPASRAKTLSATTLPAQWLLSNFKATSNPDGTCSKLLVCGPEADPDNDNLSNIEEYNFSSSPTQSDTDSDGVADGDEAFVYYTNPTKKDSDADTFDDASEPANCFDPIDSTGAKLSSARQKQIVASIKSLKSGTLSKTTQDMLVEKGVSELNIETGFNSSKCGTIVN